MDFWVKFYLSQNIYSLYFIVLLVILILILIKIVIRIMGERFVLINSLLTNMVLYMISFFQFHKKVLHRLDYYGSRFFWQGDSDKKKYWLTKWSVVSRPKDQRGLGIHNLEIKNTVMLGKWLANFLIENGVWQTLLRRKYLGSMTVS
jgi:hypothetical protein